MDLAKVMDEVAAKLAEIDGLRTYAYPADNVQPPAAVVGYPETYEFDAAFGRGKDRMSLPVWVVVGRTVDRATRDNVAGYVAGSGTSSVKAALDGGGDSYDTARVTGVEFDAVLVAGVDYLAAKYTLDIVGSGA